MRIYVVKQTQPSAEYYDKTIYAFVNETDAIQKARELNREYGECCEFTKDGDFLQVNDDCYFEDAHYYTIESIELKRE